MDMGHNGGMHMRMHMKMVVWFGCDCKFVFTELNTTSNECGLFILGCFVTLIYCVLHMYLSNLKTPLVKYLVNQQGNNHQELTDSSECAKGQQLINKTQQGIELDVKGRLILSCWYFLFSISNIIVMLLMMTMNGWVEIFIALGLALGYFLFSSKTVAPMEQNACHAE